jgi:2-C-methyl-D-erythritol 4-phosphate cytidylyltransferase
MSPQVRAVHRWAVIPAAGRGERIGAAEPKQYRALCGRTLLEHALQPFLAHAGIHGIVVVIASDDQTWSKLGCSNAPKIRTAVGGAERMLSVMNGLKAIENDAAPRDWILVHDAARPCLRSTELDRLIGELDADEVGGLLGVPLADTIKRSDDSATRVAATLDRGGLWAAQTPQMFRYDLLRRALANRVESAVAVTDEAAAVEGLGFRPRLVVGSTLNIKVTREEDLDLAEAILRSSAS